MAMDLPTFRSLWDEFASVNDTRVSQEITWAAQSIDPSIFGLDYDRATGLLAAHYLTVAPGAQMARLDPSSAKENGTNSTYGAAYLVIRDRVTALRRIF